VKTEKKGEQKPTKGPTKTNGIEVITRCSNGFSGLKIRSRPSFHGFQQQKSNFRKSLYQSQPEGPTNLGQPCPARNSLTCDNCSRQVNWMKFRQFARAICMTSQSKR
jgi:hypothetical protein